MPQGKRNEQFLFVAWPLHGESLTARSRQVTPAGLRYRARKHAERLRARDVFAELSVIRKAPETAGALLHHSTRVSDLHIASRITASYWAIDLRRRERHWSGPTKSQPPLHTVSQRMPSRARCAAQSAGSFAISRINRLVLSCGGCRPLTIAVTMSGASQRRRRTTYR